MMGEDKCFELRIRETKQLSIAAQREVAKKLKKKPKAFQDKYADFCVIHIHHDLNGLLYHKKVEPIEGTINTYFEKKIGGIDTAVF